MSSTETGQICKSSSPEVPETSSEPDEELCNDIVLCPRKLMDKLLVTCPNVDCCQEVLPRCDLYFHLVYSCKGVITNCVNASIGCSFQSTRSELQTHLKECIYSSTKGMFRWSIANPQHESESISTIQIYKGCHSLGVSIVGGCDTPLVNIIVQEIFQNGAAFKDGRIRPGDQILEINGIDLSKFTHQEAVSYFQQSTDFCKMIVYRETYDGAIPTPVRGTSIKDQSPVRTPSVKGEPSNRSGSSEGICSEKNVRNMAMDEDLDIGDDLFLTSDAVLSDSRSPRHSIRWPPDVCFQKTVILRKRVTDSLGISIAGGRFSCGYDTPIYVTNVHRDGCLAGTGKISKGDILLSINGVALVNLTHNEAVQVLKCMAESAGQLCLKIIRCKSPNVTQRLLTSTENFKPNWIYWLSLPRKCFSVKTITIERSSTSGSLGLSIVGGYRHRTSGHSSEHDDDDECPECMDDEDEKPIPIFVRSVVSHGPAGKDGRLRSGDMLISVNGHSLDGASHGDAVRLLTSAVDSSNLVTLTVVSWPGTPV